MRNKIAFICCAIVVACVGLVSGFAITLSLAPTPHIQSKTGTNTEPFIESGDQEVVIVTKPIDDKTKTQKKVVKENICPKPKKEFTDETYLDVGQDVPLEDPLYTPSDLVELDTTIARSTICIKKEAADALKDLIDAAKNDGYSIMVSSGFRDYYTQKSIVDRETKNGNTNVAIAVAKPGYSEHQLGVAVDLTSKSIAYASATGKFGDTPEALWLEQHASEYGFIESYPKGKEMITGYMYEPWHYRYVGIDNAEAIIKNGQTINEYLKMKKEEELKLKQ